MDQTDGGEDGKLGPKIDKMCREVQVGVSEKRYTENCIRKLNYIYPFIFLNSFSCFFPGVVHKVLTEKCQSIIFGAPAGIKEIVWRCLDSRNDCSGGG